jgi:tRNA(Arg) A34 adenosine deaminase TadA
MVEYSSEGRNHPANSIKNSSSYPRGSSPTPDDHMSEVRTTTRVKEIAMSYQSSIRSTSNPLSSVTNPQTSPIHRKSPANYSPMPYTQTSPYRSVTQPMIRTSSFGSSAGPGTSSSYAPLTPTSTHSVPASAMIPAVASQHISSLTESEIDDALKACLDVLTDAVKNHGKRPFSALLLAPDNSTVLQTHFSISHVRHAESELARLASIQYSTEYLSKCTLVSTWEPCAMCAGTIYWAGIGRVLYAASETKLKDLTGPNNEENMTMDLPCRIVFKSGQRQVETIGPVSSWEEKVVHESGKWWKEHNSNGVKNGSVSLSGRGSANGSGGNSIVIVQPEETVLSRIGEDGEYQADLKVDWMS